jgi:hypothetical protein
MDEFDCSAPLVFPTPKSPVPGRRLISPGNSIQVPLDPVMSGGLEPTGAPDRTFKIVFAGDSAVGKSCFIYRFCKGVFINNLSSTLGWYASCTIMFVLCQYKHHQRLFILD